MCEAFADLGHEVLLVTPQDAENELPSISDVYSYYGVKRNFKIKKFRLIRELGGTVRKFTLKQGYAGVIKRFKPDFVYGRSYEGCLVATSRNIPTCLEVHAPFGSRKQAKSEHRGFVSSPALKRVVVISEALKRLVEKPGTVLAHDKIVVAHDAASSVEDRTIVPESWPGRPDSLQVGYAGGLYPGRGVELIIEAASSLLDMDFHMMGGSSEDIAMWTEQGLPENMYFHGHVPAADVFKYRNACDVLLAPYQKKVAVAGGGDTSAFMSPLKIFEYMASGKLMLVSDMPVLREVLDDSICLFLPPTSVDAWCHALERARDVIFRTEYANRALVEFENKFTWKARAAQVLSGLGSKDESR